MQAKPSRSPISITETTYLSILLDISEAARGLVSCYRDGAFGDSLLFSRLDASIQEMDRFLAESAP